MTNWKMFFNGLLRGLGLGLILALAVVGVFFLASIAWPAEPKSVLDLYAELNRYEQAIKDLQPLAVKAQETYNKSPDKTAYDVKVKELQGEFQNLQIVKDYNVKFKDLETKFLTTPGRQEFDRVVKDLQRQNKEARDNIERINREIVAAGKPGKAVK